MRQLALKLPHEAALTREDFLVGTANEAAVGLVDRYPDWPNPVVLLIGPVGSGKTHLGQIWQAASGATRIAARELAKADPAALLSTGAVLVEDLHAGPVDQPALFHVLNLVRERGGHALLTSREPLPSLGLVLPDLVSRLRAAVPAELNEPDDDLLARVLVKLFADRQVVVEPALVDFLRRRMDRSLEAANRLVALLDQEALAAGRPITRQLAASVLARAFGPQAPEYDED